MYQRPLPHEALETRRRELVALAYRFGLSRPHIFSSAARCVDQLGNGFDILVARSPGVGLLGIAAFAAVASDSMGVELDVVAEGAFPPDYVESPRFC
ncbi:nucleotidyltransferase [Paenarthrobacter sp. JL.01a]|uniref:nucleotidyltransferase n=1 Tax=Paenarthrobacter sp. JL.01a TaxID=2979324 RepID=UPI0021C6C465|nr:nucleotidyltransferase [Paenarthrobacter sp. JL.01a]UXM90446.1 nucleotidyltransferase [Paenarthrobacter sp. JL.01a]